MGNVNVKYAGLMGSFDIVIGSISAYSAVYLVAQGFDEFQVGMITAFANLLASILQPWVGNKVDRSIRLNLTYVNILIVLPSLAFLLGLIFSQKILLLVALFYTLVLTLQATLSPFMSAIGVYLMNNGLKLNYGVCRAVESATFAVTTSILGILVIRFDENMIIFMTIVGYILYLWMLRQLHLTFLRDLFKQHREQIKLNSVPLALEKTAIKFSHKYPHFKFIIFGSFCFFVGHNFINLFMLQIVENVGGNTQSMGTAVALAAISEAPMMVAFTRINRKFSSRILLMVAAVFFLVKLIITFLAINVTGIYIAQIFQALAFGLYIVASVYYVNHEMDIEDKVKGQSFVTTAHTLGSVVGSLLGGWLINRFDVSVALLFCIIISGVGVIAYYLGLMNSKRKNQLTS